MMQFIKNRLPIEGKNQGKRGKPELRSHPLAYPLAYYFNLA
jgi:hypothetical protein